MLVVNVMCFLNAYVAFRFTQQFLVSNWPLGEFINFIFAFLVQTFRDLHVPFEKSTYAIAMAISKRTCENLAGHEENLGIKIFCINSILSQIWRQMTQSIHNNLMAINISEFLEENLFEKDFMQSLKVGNLNTVYKYFTYLEQMISFVQ